MLIILAGEGGEEITLNYSYMYLPGLNPVGYTYNFFIS